MNKRKFKQKLKEATNCTIQHDGWTCGSCFFAISNKLNNTDWNAVLIYRGDYSLEEVNNYRKTDGKRSLTEKRLKKSLEKVWELIK